MSTSGESRPSCSLAQGVECAFSESHCSRSILNGSSANGSSCTSATRVCKKSFSMSVCTHDTSRYSSFVADGQNIVDSPVNMSQMARTDKYRKVSIVWKPLAAKRAPTILHQILSYVVQFQEKLRKSPDLSHLAMSQTKMEARHDRSRRLNTC
jgi:hypothetical protein